MSLAHNGEVDIYYETFGSSSGPAFLLVNGLGSQCINYRAGFCERLAVAGFFTIRYDNRDVGLSSNFDHVPTDFSTVVADLSAGREPHVAYKLSGMASDGIAVLDDLGIKQAHVMGASMGGMIAQTMAIEHPERLLSLTSMMSSTGDSDVGRSSPEANQLLMGTRSTDREGFIAAQLAGAKAWGSPGSYNEEELILRANESFDRSFNPSGVSRQLMAIMSSGSRTKALGAVKTPTLVIHGNCDNLVNISGGRRTAEAVPGAKFVEIDGMGHDYPEIFWDQLVGALIAHAKQAGSES